MSYLVLGSCCFLLFSFFKTNNANVKIALLLGSIVLFSGGFYFISQPWIAAMHIPLYLTLASFVFFYNHDRSLAIRKYPIKKWTLFLLISFLLSGFLGDEGTFYGSYTALRFFLDSYGFFIVAFIIGVGCDYDEITEILFWPTMIFCMFGIIEAVMEYNYAYSWLIDSFPLYEGFLGKTSSVMNHFDSWRIRISITTIHPTTLGALLTAIMIFYLPKVNRNDKKMMLFFVILCMTIFLSGSRSAWVCSALYFIYYLIRSKGWLMRMVFFAVCTAGIFYVGSSIVESFTSVDRGSSLDMRQRNFLVCLVSFAEKPITGHGFNYLGNLIERDEESGYALDGAMESVVYNTMVEQGLLGAVTYIGFVVVCLMAFRRRSDKNFVVAGVGSGITVMITVFSLMSGTLGNLHSMAYVLQGACLGILYGKEGNENDSEKNGN